MQIHELKTWPRHFQAIWEGDKLFELRFNDRDYKVGDLLHLKEYEPSLMYGVNKGGEYLNREVIVKVTYILSDSEEQPEFVPDGWIIMSLQILTRSKC